MNLLAQQPVLPPEGAGGTAAPPTPVAEALVAEPVEKAEAEKEERAAEKKALRERISAHRKQAGFFKTQGWLEDSQLQLDRATALEQELRGGMEEPELERSLRDRLEYNRTQLAAQKEEELELQKQLEDCQTARAESEEKISELEAELAELEAGKRSREAVETVKLAPARDEGQMITDFIVHYTAYLQSRAVDTEIPADRIRKGLEECAKDYVKSMVPQGTKRVSPEEVPVPPGGDDMEVEGEGVREDAEPEDGSAPPARRQRASSAPSAGSKGTPSRPPAPATGQLGKGSGPPPPPSKAVGKQPPPAPPPAKAAEGGAASSAAEDKGA